MNWSQTFFHS